jgi:hypothetical protein
MTLADLLAAMAMVPIVLLSSGVIFLMTAQTSQATFASGHALAEVENSMAFLRRTVANGVLTQGAESTNSLTYYPPPSGVVYRHELKVLMPGNAPPLIYWFERPTGGSPVLKVSVNGGADFSQISFTDRIDLPDPTNIDLSPFAVDPNLPIVTANVSFQMSNSQSLVRTQSIRLQGGNGVP